MRRAVLILALGLAACGEPTPQSQARDAETQQQMLILAQRYYQQRAANRAAAAALYRGGGTTDCQRYGPNQWSCRNY